MKRLFSIDYVLDIVMEVGYIIVIKIKFLFLKVFFLWEGREIDIK